MRILVLSALVTILTTSCSKKPDAAGGGKGPGGPVPVNVSEVVRKDIPFDLRAIGNVEAISTVSVKAQVGGELIAVNFKEGQDVKKGDLLFTIQPKLYATQLAQAEANLARDRAQAASARREANRQEELDRKGAASKEQLDQSRAQADSAEATVKADEALAEIARVRLGYTTIESPIDGRTGAIRVQAGNLIRETAEDALVTIRQVAPIYVTFAVPEQYLANIRTGTAERKLPVTAHDPKNGNTLATGELTFVENTVDSTTGTVTLKATFPNDDRALWPGSFVDVFIRLSVDSNVAVVPASAVVAGQRGTQVFVVKEDATAELRPVVVGRTVGSESIVQKGLEAGEKVVINGQSRLTPGAKVVVKPAANPPDPSAPPSPGAAEAPAVKSAADTANPKAGA